MKRFFLKYQEKEMKLVATLLGIGFVFKCIIYGLEYGLLSKGVTSERSQEAHASETWSVTYIFNEHMFLLPTIVWTGYVVAYSKNIYYKVFWGVTVAVYVLDHLVKWLLSNMVLVDRMQLFSYLVLLVSALVYLNKKKRLKTETVRQV